MSTSRLVGLVNSKTNSCTTHRIEGISSSNGTNLRCQNRFHKAVQRQSSIQSRTAHARQDDAQDPRATHNRRANDGAREQCTGLRHRPEKRGASETPGRRASRVASAPKPSTQAIAHTYYTGSTRRHAKKLPQRRRRLPPDVLRVTWSWHASRPSTTVALVSICNGATQLERWRRWCPRRP